MTLFGIADIDMTGQLETYRYSPEMIECSTK